MSRALSGLHGSYIRRKAPFASPERVIVGGDEGITAMTVVLLGVAAWIVFLGFVCTLGRAAALGDRRMAEQLEAASQGDQASGGLELAALQEYARAPFPERRGSVDERRRVGRPWVAAAPGRRSTDVLEAELAGAQRALREAEARLEEARALGA